MSENALVIQKEYGQSWLLSMHLINFNFEIYVHFSTSFTSSPKAILTFVTI